MLKPYPSIKHSGVEWLGEVPAHWKVSRLKSSVANIVEQDTAQRRNDNYIALEHVESWTGRLRNVGQDAPPDSQLKHFRSGDVLFGKLRPYLAKVTRPQTGGCCVGEFLVLRSRGGDLSNDYVEQFLRSKPIIDAIHSSTSGAKMPRAEWSVIGNMAIARPPFNEQTSIVRFLDHADQRIQRYIRAKEKLIALLEEQKQAIIHQAVTGRIDVRTGQPYPAYKPSGVEWLGDVPAHWEVRRLGQLATKFGSGITPRGGATIYQDSGAPFLRSQNIHFGGLRMKEVARIPDNLHKKLSNSHVKSGDVLLNITGASIGRACSVPTNFGEGNVNQHVCIIRPSRNKLLPQLLAAYLSLPGMQREIQFKQSGASREGLTLQSIRNFKVIVLPPCEQQTIVEYIGEITTISAAATCRTQAQIDLLHEYRTRLIADVVTGKLDVRSAAAGLPESMPDVDEDRVDVVHAEASSRMTEERITQEEESR